MLIEKYIATLKLQANKNSNTKININLPVSGTIKEQCVLLNKEISKITDNKIDFSANNFMLPHITLYMGYIISDKDYNKVCSILTNYIKTFKPLELSFSKPYIKNNENYVFIDVVEKEKIFNIKKEIYQKIKPYVTDLHWDVVKEPAHITIAYVKNDIAKINKLLSDYIIKEKLKVSKINLSLSGNKGSCLGILQEFIAE